MSTREAAVVPERAYSCKGTMRAWCAFLLAVLLGLWSELACATVGLEQLAPMGDDGPVTVYYPSADAEQPLRRGAFEFRLAEHGVPVRGNGRLVVISHGSGGSPWVHADLARALVEAGFVVALPQHHADNYREPGNPGPDSWTLRPAEVSRAIDAVGADPRWVEVLDLKRVGVFGFSAGGHTALSLAGGRWSPAGFKRHCEEELEADFQSCVGLITRLKGDWLDGLKKWVALAVIRHRFGDERMREHTDPRVAAVVAAMPTAADFDMASLSQPRVPLGLVTAQHDRWLVPRFHSERVLQACTPCERIAELPTAGHGAMLSPLPPRLTGLIGDMLNDPPGFDRSVLPAVDRQVADFFTQHLLP